MHLVNYRTGGGVAVGVRAEGTVVDLAAALRHADVDATPAADMRTLLTAGPGVLTAAADAVSLAVADGVGVVDDPVLAAPVLDPPRIFAIGRNYAEHAKEGGAEVGEYPMIFFKPATCIVGDGEPVQIPPTTEKVDWEAELAVVIGTGGKYIAEDDALGHVAGYTVSNDVTARDWQRRTSQFDAGKMFDTFLPLGPVLVTADEIPDPQSLAISLTVNGETMQDGTTADMVFSVAALVSYVSHGVRLLPGDIILSGTPAGVGYARETPVFLHPGDEMTVTIEGVGSLTNPVIAER
jgi:2-keto-4-pentenoate hydratase/2-oxohepta-3-ene-1,7-dioic acid hydratase in catechol pathway